MRRRYLPAERFPARRVRAERRCEKDNWQSLYLISQGRRLGAGKQSTSPLFPGSVSLPGTRHPRYAQSGCSEHRSPRIRKGAFSRPAESRCCAGKTELGEFSTSARACPPYGIATGVRQSGRRGLVRIGWPRRRIDGWAITFGKPGRPRRACKATPIWAIVRDRTGRLWVGNENGLAFLYPGAKTFTPWPLPGVRNKAESFRPGRDPGRSRLGGHRKHRDSHRSDHSAD